MTEELFEDYIVYFSNGEKTFNLSIKTSSFQKAIKAGGKLFPDAKVTHVIKKKTPQET